MWQTRPPPGLYTFGMIKAPEIHSGRRPDAGETRRRAALGAWLIGVSLLAACGQPLLSPSDERSQYDRYDRVRNKFAQQQIEDPFGRPEPNLRGRLTPRN